jgi:hypothetical protein
MWHCHLDPTAASPAIWTEIRYALQGYEAALFPSPNAVPDELPVPHVMVTPPVLDPTSGRNQPMADDVVAATLQALGVDPSRPLLGQFAPVDHRFAPLAALGTYWMVRRQRPDVQIVLAETAVPPTSQRPYGQEQVLSAAEGDPDIHVFPAAAELLAPEINALQRGCTIALQMAVPRGFGWGLAECQWKAKPAVVGPHGDLPAQVATDSGDIAAAAPEACEAVLRLLADPTLAQERGARGHAFIAQHHLTTRLARDYVELLASMDLHPRRPTPLTSASLHRVE